MEWTCPKYWWQNFEIFLNYIKIFYFTPYSSVSIVNFEHVNADWVTCWPFDGRFQPYEPQNDCKQSSEMKSQFQNWNHQQVLTYHRVSNENISFSLT